MAEKNMNAKISVEFEETANRQQLSSGDNLPTLFGKIKKFFTDLKPVALSGSYNDLDDKLTIDSELDVNSENLIQNKAVAEAIDVLFKNRSIFTDANACTTMGTHYCATGAANVPFDCYGMMLVYTKDDGAWFIQEFYAIEDPSIHYVRTWVNDTFSDWVKVNDGGNAATANVAMYTSRAQLEDGTDILTYITSDSCPIARSTVSIFHSPTCPTNYGFDPAENHFIYDILKWDNSWAIAIAYNVRANDTFTNRCCEGIWSGWKCVADNGNADALDGLDATKFQIAIAAPTSGSIKDYALTVTGSVEFFVGTAITDMPFDNGYWFVVINKCNTNHMLIEATHVGGTKKYLCTYNAGATGEKWSAWKDVSAGGNAATVNTLYQAPITTANTLLYPTLVDSNNSTATAEAIKTNDSVKVQMKAGTTSATGYAQLHLGSTKQAGTEGNMQGQLVFFGPHHSYYAILAQNTGQTGNANYLLPATGGTLALNTHAYGTCATAAATAAKVVTTTGTTGWTLTVGSTITVKFTNTNTASNCSLNVNNTGAKQIWYNNAAFTGNSATVCGYANRYIKYVYDGTYWVWMGCSVDSNTVNTAGATNTSSKIFLIGATSQAASPQTYSHDTCYVGTDGCLYSNGEKVATESSGGLQFAQGTVTLTRQATTQTFTSTISVGFPVKMLFAQGRIGNETSRCFVGIGDGGSEIVYAGSNYFTVTLTSTATGCTLTHKGTGNYGSGSLAYCVIG